MPVPVPVRRRATSGTSAGWTRPGARRRCETRLNPKYIFETFVIGSSNRFAARRGGRGRRGAGQGLQPAADLRRLRARQDPPAARDRPLRAQPLRRRPGALRVAARSSPTSSSTRSATTGATGSSAATATSTCCSSTTSSSWRARSRRRRSSSTPSTRCTTRTSRSSSPPTAPPKRLEALEDRLRNRFEWGLITDVQPPDLETRIAILRKKAAMERLTAPPRRARVHRLQDPDEHPRARGRADPGHRVRQPQPAAGRPDPGRDRAQGPDPRGRRAGDHRGADHRPDRGVLRAVDRRPLRPSRGRDLVDGPADRDVPLPRAHRRCRCPRSGSSSAAATTRR